MTGKFDVLFVRPLHTSNQPQNTGTYKTFETKMVCLFGSRIYHRWVELSLYMCYDRRENTYKQKRKE